jgi:hypothetical protein
MHQILPDELTAIIFSFTEIPTHFALNNTCKMMQSISKNALAWDKHIELKNITNQYIRHLVDSGAQLKSLSIIDSDINDVSLAYLKGLPIQHLELCNCIKLTNDGLICLKDLPLKHLDIAKCCTNNDTLSYLKGSFLETLYIMFGEVTDEGLKYLRGLPLHLLSLSCLPNITSDGLKYLKDITSLQILFIDGSPSIDSKGIGHLRNLPLQELGIEDAPLINDEIFSYLQNMPLQELWIRDTKLVTDEGLKYLKGMKIRELDLAHCSSITDEGLSYIVDLPLETITLCGCTLVTEKGRQQFE